MPVATLHLISPRAPSTLIDILSAIKQTTSQSPSHQPIILSKPIRWIITPEIINTKELLSPSKAWELLYIHLGTNPLPEVITTHIQDHYTLQTGIPSRLLQDFERKNLEFLHPKQFRSTVSEPTDSSSSSSVDTSTLTTSSQDLTLSVDLQKWIQSFRNTHTGQNAMSMLNLLSFKSTPTAKEDYITYGREFARSIGAKRGGNAKLVGHVIYNNNDNTNTSTGGGNGNDNDKTPKWQEFALAHYPSITHFASMLASEDYQAVNQRYRVPSLRDTCILCTSEIVIERILDLKMSGTRNASSTLTNITENESNGGKEQEGGGGGRKVKL